MPTWTKKQKEYGLNANHRWNVKLGAVRSGKTFQDKEDIIPRRIRERANKDGLVFIIGVTEATVERNVLRPMRDKFGNNLVGTINKNKVWLFGEECYCLGAEKINQVAKIQGASIKYLYGDEVVKWNKEVFDMIKSRLDQPYSCSDLTGNPEQKTHWFKEFIESDADIYVQHYTIDDNDFLSIEFKENLKKEYEGTVLYNRYILGQWCNAEGLIFRQIADDKERFITDKPLETGIISIGIDWGGNGSKHSITATRIRRDFRILQTLKSDVKIATGTDTKEVMSWIIKFIKEILVTYGNIECIWCDSAEQVLNNTLRTELKLNNLHIPVKDSIKTEISDRIEMYNILLNTDRISFLKNKTNTIVEALQTALYDEDAPKDVWIDDGKTSDIDSLDSFNYSFEYWFKQLASTSIY